MSGIAGAKRGQSEQLTMDSISIRPECGLPLDRKDCRLIGLTPFRHTDVEVLEASPETLQEDLDRALDKKTA
jgi:hypothetical protein